MPDIDPDRETKFFHVHVSHYQDTGSIPQNPQGGPMALYEIIYGSATPSFLLGQHQVSYEHLGNSNSYMRELIGHFTALCMYLSPVRGNKIIQLGALTAARLWANGNIKWNADGTGSLVAVAYPHLHLEVIPGVEHQNGLSLVLTF